ncbi:receptor-like cytosolic serine/threonine-protein kinase RBK2 isoform X2 [Diospyros lotus]|uniref:receptor-like cytosolic serine/threonine-protein kinase RBK2 isoform X2 n=1 Tax=Diospyros lotus TaxID=55363 RepID=UPI00224EA1E3|nr:receptor-like cytosolic serine/threonine-protein kinase RBK2 isoform X2 [Diospyros lotus]
MLRRRFNSFASAQDLRCFEIEKEKEDISSPRGVLEACIRGLDTEAGPREANSSSSEPKFCDSDSRPHPRWRGFVKLWKKGPIKRLPSFPPFSVPRTSRSKSRNARENINANFCYFKSSWKNFTLSELRTATKNFRQENLIGSGGYADVYKGRFPDGQLVAIKRLNKGPPEEQITSFLSEIGTIAHVNHPNTAKLIGFGVEGGIHLVLELSPLGSLGSLLRGSREKLNWAVRYKIIVGTAKGLLYLHENCPRRIIHRDIKADNILLTEDFEPQICDFGLAKWLPKEWTHHNVPKFEELITGREALDETKKSLVLWAKPLLDGNCVKKLVDPSLHHNYDAKEMDCVILTASMCIDQTPSLRPRMSQVVNLLRGEHYNAKCSPGSQKRFLQRTFSEELLDAAEYNSTKYLKDMSRHKEIALGS